MAALKVLRTPPAGGDVIVLPVAQAAAPDDASLVARALGGEGWAFEAIYRRHVGIVAGTCRRMLRDAAETEDVVQETFLIAFEDLAALSEPAALRVWLVRIGVSRVHRRFRRRRLIAWLTGEHAATSLEAQAAPGLSPAERAELALVDRALAPVPPERRTPWIMRHVLGYPLEEIAEVCGCSLATVKRRIADVEGRVAAHVRDRAEDGLADAEDDEEGVA
jgi:RNA polymerase sigma-70 factor (ECF subfamily)